jgi:hypothetical protein
VRKPPGDEWEIHGVGVPVGATEEAVIAVQEDSLHEDLIVPASNQWYRVDVTSETLHLRVPSGARLRQVDGTFDSMAPFGTNNYFCGTQSLSVWTDLNANSYEKL